MPTLGARRLAGFLGGLLNVVWVLVAVMFVIMIGLTIAAPRVAGLRNVFMDIPVSFAIEGPAGGPAAPLSNAGPVPMLALQGSGRIAFPPPNSLFLACTAASVSILLGALLWILGQLRAVFSTLRAGTPFAHDNARRIRRIGYAVIAGEVARTIVAYLGASYVASHLRPEGFHPRLDINLLAIASGLVVLVVAEVFRLGAQLDEEQALTV